MTFLHKLSQRLARLKFRPRSAVAAVSAAMAIVGCELPSATSEPTPTVTQVVVSPQAVTVLQGELQDFVAVGYTATGDTAPITVTWSTTGGSLTDKGTQRGRHYGQYKNTQCGGSTVTATAQPGNVSGRASVTVLCPATVVSIVVTPAADTVPMGLNTPLTATPKDSAGNPVSVTVTWLSSNTAIATVDGSGLVTGVAAGSATITASAGGQSATSAITVIPDPVVTVAVSPASANVATGQAVQLTASPQDANGYTLTGRLVTWTSSNTSVASVSTGGLVTGVGAGSATITATSENVKGTAAITVTTVAVALVSVTPSSATLQVSQTVQLTATPKDASGNTLTGRTVTWGSSSKSVASVDGSGLVTATGSGSATITATSEGKSGTAAITVTTSQPASGCGATGSGTCYYVATTGSDANPGTSALPFRTLQQAANVVNPGDGVLVSDGVYTGGSTVVLITRSGTSSAWITFTAAHKWGAVIDGQRNASSSGVSIRGNFIRFQGFEVRGSDRSGIEAYNGSETNAANHDVVIAQNFIHDIGRECTDDTGGRSGVDVYATNVTVERNLIQNIGRYAAGENGCNPSSTNYQNHDHGIYAAVGDNTIIRNNVFVNCARGWAVHRYSGQGASMSGFYVLNNTFDKPNPWKPGQIVIAGKTTGLVIANNIFSNPNTAGIWFDASDGGTWSGAIVQNNLSTTALATGAAFSLNGSVENTTPRFASSTDYHLQSGSPAVNTGATFSQVANDFDGIARPQGSGYDIGGYEFH
jgi:uncharacterized protein YjdB